MAELEHKRIAGRIKKARNEAGITQHQMAELLGVIQRTYQNYESETNPRIPWDRMSDIERITGKKVEWLLHGDAPDLLATLDGGAGSLSALVQAVQALDAKLDDALDQLGAMRVSQSTEASAIADLRSQIARLEESLASDASAKS